MTSLEGYHECTERSKAGNSAGTDMKKHINIVSRFQVWLAFLYEVTTHVRALLKWNHSCMLFGMDKLESNVQRPLSRLQLPCACSPALCSVTTCIHLLTAILSGQSLMS